MEIIPVRTRRLELPKDDLLAVLKESLPQLQEGDIVAIASKVVAIHEGRFRSGLDATGKKALIEEESDHIIPAETPHGWDITVKNRMISFAAGIDESNVGEGNILLLPADPLRAARDIREFLKKEYGLTRVGVIITDSSGIPYRQGILALSIGHAGFVPVNDERGVPDLFGRPFNYTFVNVADALAVAAGYVMGETDESTPVAIVRDAPRVEYTDEDRSAELVMPPEDDIFYPLLKGTYE